MQIRLMTQSTLTPLLKPEKHASPFYIIAYPVELDKNNHPKNNAIRMPYQKKVIFHFARITKVTDNAPVRLFKMAVYPLCYIYFLVWIYIPA